MDETDTETTDALNDTVLTEELLWAVLVDALAELGDLEGASYVGAFAERQIARRVDRFRGRIEDASATTQQMVDRFVDHGTAALREAADEAERRLTKAAAGPV